MPIRIVCPSCSAALTIKDELAGRALKCPKCGGVIPASQTGGSATSPPLAPPKPAFEEVTEPTKAKTGSKVTGVPAPRVKKDDEEEDEDRPRRKKRDDDEEDRGAKSKKRDEDEEDEERPRSKKRDDDEDEDRPRRKKRDKDEEDEDDRGAKNKKSEKGEGDEDEEDEERPTKKRKKQDDDEDDDRPSGKKKKKKGSKTGLIIGVVAGVLLLCCGSGVGLTWYFISKVGEELNPKNDKVTAENFKKVQYGMTRAEVEAILGPGKLATPEKLSWISDIQLLSTRQKTWNPKINLQRVYYWQNDTDGIFLAFYPDTSPTARVQMREYMSKTGTSIIELGMYSEDATFEKQFGKKK